MQSPSEETAQAALLLWVALSRTVPAVCTSPPCQEMAKIHVATKTGAELSECVRMNVYECTVNNEEN
jgi:hypothetical protein